MALTLCVDRFWASPYVFSAYVALEEKGLPYEVKEVGLDRKDQHQPSFVNPSLTGRVPALEHDGFWLTESNVIDESLDEAFPPPKYARLIPAALQERAR